MKYCIIFVPTKQIGIMENLKNTYVKFAPNVFIAKCFKMHEKGDTITLTTKYGKEHECIVFNPLGNKDGNFFYSVVRADGYNYQDHMKRKADRYAQWASSAEHKSTKKWEESNEGKDFLVLAEPIKVGHHSEKRHRALIERNYNRMEKAVAFADKAKEHQSKSEYWESKANDINLSMPESLEYFEFELEKAKEYHEGLKAGKYERTHSYSLTYAKKKVNEMTKKFDLAKKLWGE